MAAMFLAGTLTVACTNDESLVNESKVDEKKYEVGFYTQKGEDAATRALSIDGSGSLNATWKTGEKAYAYNNTTGYLLVGSVKAKADGAMVEMYGYLYGSTISVDDELALGYPSLDRDYSGQTGVLLSDDNSIEKKYDYASGLARVTSNVNDHVDAVDATTGGAIKFENQQAIVKFSLTNGTNPINATEFIIHASDNHLISSYTASTKAYTYGDIVVKPSSSTLYVALPYDGEGCQWTLTAIDASSDIWTYTSPSSNAKFVKGKYYEGTVTMTKKTINTVDLSTKTGANAAYTAITGDVLTGTGASDTHITIADGAVIFLDNANITTITNNESHKWSGLTCAGDATIILKDGSTNEFKGGYEDYPGIYVPAGKTVTIKGSTGSLTASSNGYGAGIGAGYNMSCGNIVIDGGNITATGGSGAAGIGSNQKASCGNITIYGGTIIATGGSSATGIGSGSGQPGGGTCGNITIVDGTITATGGQWAAGIGSGANGTCGNITIKNGSISGTGKEYGAGIGHGDNAKCGDITIDGGTIVADAGSSAAAIGGGFRGTCGKVTIGSDLTKVTATKGCAWNDLEYIGKGYESTCGTVKIDGTTGARHTNTFTNYTSTYDSWTWTLTHK